MKNKDTNKAVFDIAIAGAGPVGATLALACAQTGFSTLLLTRDHAPDEHAKVAEGFDGRAYSIAAGCWRMWMQLGVATRLQLHAQPVFRIEAEAEGGPPLVFDVNDMMESDGALGYLVEASRINHVLWDMILSESRIDVADACEIQAVEADNTHVRIGVAGDTSGYRARVVVGCDGKNSAIRRLAGIGFPGHDYDSKGLVATVKLEQSHGGAARQVFLPSGPFAVLPLPDNCANLVWTERAPVADTLMAMSDNEFTSEMRARVGAFLGDFTLIGPRYAYPLMMRVADSFVAPRIALAGDAAHVIHPLAGQGLNLGLKDVAALAQTLVDADRTGLDMGALMTLQSYENWRRSDTVSMALGMEAFDRMFSAPAPIRKIAGMAMALAGRSSFARGVFTREAGGLSGELPRLFRGEALI